MDVSIIIPTYNGGTLLAKTLTAIFNQQTTKSFEVVVVDSGSRSDTLAILAEFPIRLYQIPNTEFNHGGTRDLAIGYAQGEFVILINQDATPGSSSWLDLMVQPLLDRSEVSAVQGGIRERDDMGRFFWESCGDRFYFTSESKNWIARYFNMGFSTVNCAIRRSVWQQHPFGQIQIFEDKAWQRQIHRSGNEIVYSDGFVYHTHDYTFNQLWRRCEDEGYGWRLVGESYSWQQAVRDTFRLKNYQELLRGIRDRQVKKWSEIVYPFLRPYWVYKGNHFNRSLR
ncbi:MAG: glycosyltransferase family 2 protein [Pseudanabaenaceae cyanobacterium bins.68]|nr:glycosyltransferase family 2 protein [Pseudanabaenaceae cyanobacterium bins.68]